MSTPKFISSPIELAIMLIIKVVEQSEWPATKPRRRLRMYLLAVCAGAAEGQNLYFFT